MRFTRSAPIEYPIDVSPGQVMIIEFRAKGKEYEKSKISIDLYIHYLTNPLEKGSGSGSGSRYGSGYGGWQLRGTNMVNSGPVSVLTDERGSYKSYTIKLIAPNFNITNVTKSVIYITTYSYDGVEIDDLIVDNESKFEERKRFVNNGFSPSGEDGVYIGGVVFGVDGLEKMFDSFSNIEEELKEIDDNRIWFIRPWSSHDSFGVVGNYHIQELNKLWDSSIGERSRNCDSVGTTNCIVGATNCIVDTPWEVIKDSNWMKWDGKRNILLHPILYPFVVPGALYENLQNFGKILGMKRRIGGWDVADSNKIGRLAVHIVNKLDLIMVPSKWSLDAYVNSGVRKEICQILEHGVGDEFVKTRVGLDSDDEVLDRDDLDSNDLDSENEELKVFKRLKDEGNILVLFFDVHSGYRKGEDLVAEVMMRIQKKEKEIGDGRSIVLVVKGGNGGGNWGLRNGYDLENIFDGVKKVEIRSWLSERDLRILYDVCDICLSPSRGGGFELNALEAISRGLPTLVTNGGCFEDMVKKDYYIGVNVRRMVQPLPFNPVHIGVGPEADINDFEKKLEDVINRLDWWKKIFRDRSKIIRENYTWRNTAKRLEGILTDYDFIK